MSRSATIRRMIASCWKSFWPNTATCGRIAPNSLATTVGDAAEVARAAGAFQRLGERARARRGSGSPSGYMTAAVGAYTASTPRSATDGEVVVDRSRVGVEVVAAVELQRVDEDRHDDDIGVSAGLVDQRQVAGVQRAHRRHQHDALPADVLLVGSTRCIDRGS